MKNILIKRICVLICIMVFMASCLRPQEPQVFRKSASIMYTDVTITVTAFDAQKAEQAIEAAFDEIRALEKLLSFWTDDSEIAELNRNAGSKAVTVSPDTMEVLQRAMFISKKTSGAFDATIGPVIKQWDFKKRLIPTADSLAGAIDLVNYRVLKLKDDTAFLSNASMSFDTGGIAKGFAADKAIESLKAADIKGALVAVAGDIRAFGTRANGKPWRIGIKHPRSNDPESIIASIALNDVAISTSGDYERFFIYDEIRYHHILDPKTGYPAKGTMSVTVIAPEAVYTDGLSTGIFVMGAQRGIKLLEELGFDGIIISSEGETFVTSAIADKIQWKDTPYKPK